MHRCKYVILRMCTMTGSAIIRTWQGKQSHTEWDANGTPELSELQAGT
jgi:hypothetical protein